LVTEHNTLPDPGQAKTLPQLIRAAAAAYGNDTAVTLKRDVGDESITFAEWDRRSATLARGLIARGVGKGTRIGFIYGNGPSFALMFAAIARVGAIAVPISTFIKSNELARVFRQSDIAGVVVQRQLLGNDYVARLCDALPGLASSESPELRLTEVPFLRWVVSDGASLPSTVRDISWITSAADSVSEALLVAIESEVHPTDQLMEIYTSGSMAFPKGVKHNHGPTLFRTHFLRSKSTARRGAEIPAVLPMFWVGGLMMTLLPNWEIGATTVCTDSTSTNSRMAMGVVLAEGDMPAMPAGATIWALGMTETLGPYSYADEFRAPGYPLSAPLDHIADGYEVRVVDEEGNPCVEGVPGEIQVRGYPLTPGLHKVENSEYFEADGFYRTGDMGVVDGKRIHFVGRNGDIIKTASTNVSPAEVEFELQQLDAVHSAYVVGIPDRERGQLVVAAIVPRDGVTPDFDDIRQKLHQRLSGYKVPREYVAITREEVPMLPSNKVARRQIETMMVQRLGRKG
jgi:acyl-CoA synthetase (AMP-forming)/AMP-acid ligase II